MIPCATYRLQFHKEFPFEAALPLAPYLRSLGISHVYSSPILQARSGSVHGYDVIDQSVINPELGGEEGFRQLAGALRAHGIGLIVDIVPNHMAVDGGNRWWGDVLTYGRASRFADFFDIDWDALREKVLLPVLGQSYWEALNAGEIRVAADQNGGLSVRYFDKRWPLRLEDRSVDVGEFGSAGRLNTLLERQHYRLAWWRTANDIINWRRFFDVSDLIALKQEVQEVFERTHAKIFELYGHGLIDGVRVDHVDGLADPGDYCRRLRTRLNELAAQRTPPDEHPYLVVEKILGHGEELPGDWGVDGTTGYDFMNEVSALQHEPSGGEPLSDLWHTLTGRSREFESEEVLARGQIVQSSFEGALTRTADHFHKLAQTEIFGCDITYAAIRRALVMVLQHMRVYRTYPAAGRDPSPVGALEVAAAAAREGASSGDEAAIDFVERTISGSASKRSPGWHEAVRRFNQLSAPVAAKAVEDTAFYRYGRLLSRNDVGFEPGTLALSVPEFHKRMTQRATGTPHSMLATATHDHKRGEDVRARLAVLSEIPTKWASAVENWFRANGQHRPGAFDAADEYQLYQTLVGAWPLDLRGDDREYLKEFCGRVVGWQQKALREAKLRSSWLDPDFEYERSACAFTHAILDPAQSGAFLHDLVRFIDSIARGGALNGLVQAVLRCTVPGMPDCYQGTEFWDFSLVDPDNRRPVNYRPRVAALEESIGKEAQFLTGWKNGRVKQAIISRVLGLRRRWPAVFAGGSYLPLEVTGERAAHVLAYARVHRDTAVLVAAPLRVAMHCDEGLRVDSNFWMTTTILAPQSGPENVWQHLFDGNYRSEPPQLECQGLFANFPLAVLVRT